MSAKGHSVLEQYMDFPSPFSSKFLPKKKFHSFKFPRSIRPSILIVSTSIVGDSARARSLSRQPPYCPNSVSTCIGTENLRSHTEPVSSASSTTLAFSFSVEIGWYHIAIWEGCGIISKFYQNSIPSCFPVFGSCLEGQYSSMGLGFLTQNQNVHLLNHREW